MNAHTTQEVEETTPAEKLRELSRRRYSIFNMPICQETILQMFSLKGEYEQGEHFTNAYYVGKRIEHYQEVMQG